MTQLARAAALVLVACCLWAAANAAAKPNDAAGPQGGTASSAAGKSGGKGPAQRPVPADPPPSATTDDDQQSLGQVNPLQIENPICGEGLAAAERRNCDTTGTPEGRYPTSNYGFEIHIETGITHIVGNFQSLLAHIADAIWMALLFVANLVLTLLGWAFSLSPFTDNRVMSRLSSGLERFYAVFTSRWLVFAIVAIGAVAVWRGLVKREVSQTLGGLVVSVLLMILALWIIHEPRETVGTVAGFANSAAQAVIAAPQSGSLRDPEGSYAQATSEVWRELTLPGFAALNFSDMGWALDDADPKLVAKANEKACLDYAYLHSIPSDRLRELLDDGFDIDCEGVAGYVPAPRTNAEIWLRNSPGSEARDSLWDEFNDVYPYSGYLAIQGDAGAWTRLPMVLLVALGMLGGIALLAWLALRIFVQTAVAFVLVVTAPIALFLPAFGERGRAAFTLWGGTLLGALISKLVYAALLSAVLFATTVISGAMPSGTGAFMGFLVVSGLWWSVFIKRQDIISFLSIADGHEGGSGRFGDAMGLYAYSRLAERAFSTVRSGAGKPVRGVTGAAKAAAGVGGGGASGVAGDRGVAATRVASQQLDSQAAQRLSARYESERAIVARQAERKAQLASISGGRGSSSSRGGASGTRDAEELRRRIDTEAPRVAAARDFVSGADERERASGARFGKQEIGEAREAIRREVDQPVESGAHAWRVGMEPDRYRALSGREREDAHRSVASQLRSDRLAFGAIPDRPGGLVGRGERSRYRRHVRSERPEAKGALREAQQHARRARRQPSRRGVSR